MRREPDEQQLRAREAFVEGFYGFVVAEMEHQGVRRSALAERMGCAPANVTQILKQKANLTVASMVDLAYHLGLKVELDFISTLAGGERPDGTIVVVERNIFNPEAEKRTVPTWAPVKKTNHFMKMGA